MITLKIEGMTCNHCVGHVRAALAAVPGVAGTVAVTLAPGEAKVPGNPESPALVAALLAAVAEEGYQAFLVP